MLSGVSLSFYCMIETLSTFVDSIYLIVLETNEVYEPL